MHEAIHKTMQMRSEAHASTHTQTANADTEKKRANAASKETRSQEHLTQAQSLPRGPGKASPILLPSKMLTLTAL